VSSVEQLISDGVKAIAYIPFEDTPKDNSKAVFHWDKRPELTVETELKPKHNIAIKPDFKWVDIDFDCDEAKQLMNGYFNPTYLFGRDERGHALIEVSDPTQFPLTKVQFGKDCLIEMRGEGCYSVAQGTLTGPDGEASFKKTDYGKPLSYKECRKKFFEIGLLCQLKRGFNGAVNNFIIPIVGEMIFKGIEINHCTEIMMKFLKLVDRFDDREKETKKSILSMYKKNKPSKIEKMIDWSTLQQTQVENVIDEIVSLTKEETVKERKRQRLETKTLTEIKNTNYPPLIEVVSKILTTGLFFFSAKPKVGKSFLGLALTYAVSKGNNFLGLKTEQGSCLYLAYEDSEARIRRRSDDMGMEESDCLEFAFKSEKLMDGLEEQLIQWIEDKKAYGQRPLLIIIDTYIRSQDGKAGAGNNSYEIDSSKLDRLQREMLLRDVCCMFITHDKKVEEADKLNNMSGSIAFQGQDGIWHLDKNRTDGSTSSTLHVEPRDLEPQEYEIHMNDAFQWENIGTPMKKSMDKTTRHVLEAVEEVSKVRGDAKPQEVWQWILIHKPREGEDSVPDTKQFEWAYSKKIYSLFKKGMIVRGEKASSYMLPQLHKNFEDDAQSDVPF
jgi:RecA-family ATPase